MQKNTPCQTEGFNSSTSAVQTENLIHTLCKKNEKDTTFKDSGDGFHDQASKNPHTYTKSIQSVSYI